ncbi:hypothetical protein EDD18DRAFT_1148853 [Armillaria luteobubalina]|uniref:Uncharacterized protein n=1 Tax=Armillaria luteobubalina TaxID=153913 RepID=A0AA39QCY4_9AGAR|nr:hypothetical protein EDD18DRAFT_1148853 [Armillaria luteobubalina]
MIQLISSALLHLYAYIRHFLSYLSTTTLARPSDPAHSNVTPFLYDSPSLDDLERGLQDPPHTTRLPISPFSPGRTLTFSADLQQESVMDISRADSDSELGTLASRPSSAYASQSSSFRSSYNPLRRKSYSLSHFPPPDSEPSLHQRKRSSTVWFKKPTASRDYRYSNYDDDRNVVARVRRAIEECAEEEDVRAIFDRRSAWGTIKSVITEEDFADDSFSTYSSPLESAKNTDMSELAYTNQDSAMVSSVSTFVAGFPTYKSLDKVLAALALQSTGAEVSWSDLVLFSEDNRPEDKLVLESTGSDASCSDLLSLEVF